MKCVIIETPYAGDIERNVKYAQLCMRDSLKRGESPYASHLLYTQPNVLDDDDPIERKFGIEAGFAWKHMQGVTTVFYVDYGWSGGMKLALDYCQENNLPFTTRKLLTRLGDLG